MAKSCGIHIGQRRYAVVVLDGSAKKHTLVLQEEGEIPPGDDPIQATALALREVAKKIKVPGENIGLAIDSGLGAYRTLSLPFDDESKIEDVIKFEVESELPQWDIDEVIIDFLTLDSTPGVESTLLVTAVPKDRLEARIRACERAGLEPYEAELDTTALFNAAHACEMLHPDGAQVIVHVGDGSTSVVVVDGGHLAGMRSIHTGATPPMSVPARMPEDGEGDDDEFDEDAEVADEAPSIDQEEVRRLRSAAANRIRRELARTLSAANTENPIEGIYVTGLQLPELYEGPILDVPVAPFVGLPGEGDDVGESAVAYGVALRQLGGGVLKGTLRREELRYSGKFERLELPFAVLSLLLLTTLWVHLIVIDKQILWRGEGNLAKGHKGDLQIWLEASNAFMLPIPEEDQEGRLTDPPENIAKYCAEAQAGEDSERNKMDELRRIDQLLTIEIETVKKQLGHISEVTQPQSALEAITTVLDVISNLENKDEVRIGFRTVVADTAQTRSGNDPYVQVKLDLDFFGEDPLGLDATQYYNHLANEMETYPWCTEFARKQSKVLEDGGKGISVEGITIQVNTTKIPKENA